MSYQIKMVNGNTIYSDELYHHGILGMRWGVRRTAAQLGHYTKKIQNKITKPLSKAYKKSSRKLEDDPDIKATKKATKEIKERYKTKNIKKMTDEEIQAEINRRVMEKQLKNLRKETMTKGEAFAKTVGNDILKPAAIQIGKNALTTTGDKLIKEYLGEKPKQKTEYEKLNEEYNLLNVKRNIENLKKDNSRQQEVDKMKAERDYWVAKNYVDDAIEKQKEKKNK